MRSRSSVSKMLVSEFNEEQNETKNTEAWCE